jgi:hypothetical protein
MRINQSEIIDEILEHIRKNGGEHGEWWVGTAKEMQGLGIREQGTDREGPQTLENRSALPNLISREAYTPYAADGVIDYLKGLGLRRDPHSIRGSFIFVYRQTASAASAPTSDQATFTARAA